MKKHNQLLLVVMAFLITTVCIYLLSSTAVIGAMSGAFLVSVGAYTALDLKAMVKATGTLPQGQYKTADKWKYFVGILLLALLFLICYIKQYFTELNLELSYGFLGPGIVAIITIIISGIKMNKAATLDGPSVSSGAG